MKGTAKRKVVTSGRLTGGVRVQPARRRVTPNPVPAACPEPAYSLYSTDSEDQVTNLHKGLDRCAALLSGILQAENTEPKPSPLRAVKGGAAKSRSSTSLGKKTSKKPPTKTDQKSSQSVHRGPGSTTPRSPHVFSSPAAHSGVTLHPPKKHTHTLLQSPVSPSQNQTRQLPYLTPSQPQPSTCPPQPQPSILLSVSQSNSLLQSPSHPDQPPLSHTDCQSAAHTLCKADRSCSSCDREQEESVPVRDTNTQSSGTDPHTGVRDTHSHIHTCTMKMSKLQLEAGQADTFPQDTHSGEDSSAETEVKQRTVQYLLGELKALIAGQGSVAERLLSHLEQTVSSPLMNVSSSNSPAESAADLQSLHIQNSQLRRRVRILNQQLKEREKAERQQNMETLCDSQVSTLQEELTSAQSRLQELQDDLAELRKALQDTQSQLRDREAENALVKTDLEATRCRLLHSEREKSELASLVQQRLEEIENLNRILQRRRDSSVSDASPTKQHCNQHQHRQDPPEPPTDRITQYLMSLDQLEPTHVADRNACVVAAEREGNAADEKKLRETSTHPDMRSHRLGSDEVQSYGRQMGTERRRLFDSTLSQSDVESVTSEWSMRSGSTFDTRDEAAFRDGLAALDASIASLQKTIKLDLGR
ncbi:coiled-coil domain-containing protein 14 [Thunnus albacares]|uniref:coiled-coil domain-containing protein 14 n=1 Tax=Thunnus albacares TaxID=8236 RepID=UPI001CF67AD3|nr:coiled-coil domain-containing protein 14 [Thunnus albacares]